MLMRGHQAQIHNPPQVSQRKMEAERQMVSAQMRGGGNRKKSHREIGHEKEEMMERNR